MSLFTMEFSSSDYEEEEEDSTEQPKREFGASDEENENIAEQETQIDTSRKIEIDSDEGTTAASVNEVQEPQQGLSVGESRTIPERRTSGQSDISFTDFELLDFQFTTYTVKKQLIRKFPTKKWMFTLFDDKGKALYSARVANDEYMDIVSGMNFDKGVTHVLMTGNKMADFVVRERTVTGREIVTLRLFYMQNESKAMSKLRRIRMNFVDDDFTRVPEKLRTAVSADGKDLNFNELFGGRPFIESRKNQILKSVNGQVRARVMIRRTDRETIAIDISYGMTPVAVLALGIVSFVGI